MRLYVPGRVWEPDPRVIDRNDPVAMADYERRKADFYNKPLRDEGPMRDTITRPTRDEGPMRDTITRPTRDINIPRDKERYLRERDAYTGPNPWGPGEKPQDWGRTSPREKWRGEIPEKYRSPANMDQSVPRPLQEPPIRTDWWRDDHRGKGKGLGTPDFWKRLERRDRRDAKRRQKPLLPPPGGIGHRLGSDEDRFNLLTGGRGIGGRNTGSLGSNEERMRLLTGASDPVSKPCQSQYGGREEYDPQDRKFNRQFDERPKGPQPWDPSPRNDQWGSRIGQTGPGTMDYIDSDGDKTDDRYQTGPGAPKTSSVYDDSALRKRLAALEERGPIVNQPTQDLSGIRQRLKELESRPQGTGGNWNEERIAALEGKNPQDLSGITGRISELEGRQPSWQEDRIKSLEGRQDDTSWRDPLSQVQAGQQAGQQARSALDTRLAALEDYYKNDPPPEDSVGDRYEDKLANINKLWEQQGSTWDKVKDTVRSPGSGDDRKWSEWNASNWASQLPNPYVQQVRDLHKEYNKPQHTAIIKGREYKSYGPRATERLKYLDTHNIHEDQYLGSGTWKDQYGDTVSGWGKGNEDRYFASQSGLDKDSDDYKLRFRGDYQYWKPGQGWGTQTDADIRKYLKEKDYSAGKDFAYYN